MRKQRNKFFELVLWISFLAILPLTVQCQNERKMEMRSYKNIHPESVPAERKLIKTEAEWEKELGKEAYNILRLKGTEYPFSGKYNKHKGKGKYVCAACKNELFASTQKFDSGCGWPSFFAALAKDNIIIKTDKSHGMIRTEIMCAKCDGHLGHLFDDGPEPTGLRYCVNSVSIEFVEE